MISLTLFNGNVHFSDTCCQHYYMKGQSSLADAAAAADKTDKTNKRSPIGPAVRTVCAGQSGTTPEFNKILPFLNFLKHINCSFKKVSQFVNFFFWSFFGVKTNPVKLSQDNKPENQPIDALVRYRWKTHLYADQIVTSTVKGLLPIRREITK